MKKKIITLVLAAIMCLSAITPVTATSTLNRVASTIPGTDIEYNYVENVTIKIPGTEVTYDLTGIYEKVGIVYEDGTKFDENFNIYANFVDYPVYRFAFLQNGGKLKLSTEGEYAIWFAYYGDNGGFGDGYGADLEKGYEISPTFTYPDNRFLIIHPRDAGNVENPRVDFRLYETYIYEDGTCNASSNDGDCVAKVEFYFGYGGNFSNGRKYPYDLISFKYDKWWHIDDECYYYDDITADIEKMDISLLDVNYEESIDYNVIEGANSVVNSDENLLTIRVDGDFDKFKGVKVDGDLIDSSNYTATEGSTIIDFKSGYLETLNEGEHTVSVVFTDGEATTKFEIKNYIFTIQEPSRTTIRSKDGIILHSNIEGTVPTGSYVEWTASNNKFKTTETDNGKALKIISNNNGYTTFTATLYDADGNELACDTVEMYSKAGFFDKIGGFFRSLFGTTKIYEN